MRAPSGVACRTTSAIAGHDQPEEDAGRNAERPRIAEPGESGFCAEIGAAAGDEDEQALQEGRHGQRHDHRMDAQKRDAEAVDEADAGGDGEDGDERDDAGRVEARRRRAAGRRR